MGDELALTEDQKARIKELNQQEKAELKALHDSNAEKEDKRAQLDAIRKSYLDKREAVMTPEQRDKARQMREKLEQRRQEHRREKPADQN